MLLKSIAHALWSAVVGLATLVFIVEEWLWDTLKTGMAAFGRLPGIRRIESWIGRLPPAGAAFFFALPTTLALPVKLIALHQITQGHLVRGTLVIIAAKVLATALFARMYMLTQPALMQVRWFVAMRAAVLRWRDWAYAQIESHPLWRAIRARVAQWRAGFAAWRAAWRARVLAHVSAGGQDGAAAHTNGLVRRWRALQRLNRMRRRRRAFTPGSGDA
jgi:hypothetical protein